jgi:hypothetical protein
VPKNSVCFLLIVLLIGCETNSSEGEQKDISSKITAHNFHLLIFKKELKLEVWEIGIENTFLDSFNLKKLQQLPIGQFNLSFDENKQKLLIDFPNEFYKDKGFGSNPNLRLILDKSHLPERFFNKNKVAEISKIIIFPNDNRLGGKLTPCFACPHWMAEIYAFLNLKKKEYI